MAINKQIFLKTNKIGDDLVASSLNEVLDAGLEVLGDAENGGDGSGFRVSSGEKKAPFFLIRAVGHQAQTVWVSAKVAEQVENIMDCLDGYPVRKFTYPAKDAQGAEIPGQMRESIMLCMPSTAANAKYKSIAEKVAAIKQEKAAELEEAKAKEELALKGAGTGTP